MLPFPNNVTAIRVFFTWFPLVLTVLVPFATSADEPDSAAIAPSPDVQHKEVARLIDRLASPSRSERVAAQKALLDLGPVVLRWLPTPDATEDPQVRESLRQLRTELEQRQALESLQPRTVTLHGRFTLGDALQQLSEATGNPVDSGNLPGELREREVSIDFEEAPFWHAFLKLAHEHGLQPEPSQDGQSIQLKEAESTVMEGLQHAAVGACLVRVWPAKLQDVRDDADRNLLEVRLDLLLEPRLHAVFLRYRLEDFELNWVGGEELAPFTPGASYERPLVGGIGATLRERFISESPPDGNGLQLRGRVKLRTAAIQESFRFAVGNISRPSQESRGGVTAKLLSTRHAELSDGTTILKARLSILYDQAGPEFESHRAGQLYRNAWLETGPPPERTPAEVTLLRQTDRGAEVELQFRNVKRSEEPWTIVYQAPRQFVDLPVVFEFERIPSSADP